MKGYFKSFAPDTGYKDPISSFARVKPEIEQILVDKGKNVKFNLSVKMSFHKNDNKTQTYFTTSADTNFAGRDV